MSHRNKRKVKIILINERDIMNTLYYYDITTHITAKVLYL
jgi:hypothetical protein